MGSATAKGFFGFIFTLWHVCITLYLQWQGTQSYPNCQFSRQIKQFWQKKRIQTIPIANQSQALPSTLQYSYKHNHCFRTHRIIKKLTSLSLKSKSELSQKTFIKIKKWISLVPFQNKNCFEGQSGISPHDLRFSIFTSSSIVIGSSLIDGSQGPPPQV